ncbi:glycosyltransferase [Roseicyclus sp.]|uniref:glycosyltransferase n=1 Tax=Roseicyclus sp. TaxID=1914329 RepID=UPI003F6D1E12
MIELGTTKVLRRLSGRIAKLAGRGDSAFEWQIWYRNAVRRRTVASVLGRHEKAALLAQDFSVGAYLTRNPDVADVVASPGEAVFHYLEYGHAEGRDASPDRWSRSFVRLAHNVDLPDGLSARQALARLRKSGLCHSEILLHEGDLWASKGLNGAVLAQIFDHEYYLVTATLAGHAPSTHDRLGAIAHFCDRGLPNGIAPHPEHGLDLAFYRDACALAEVALPPDIDEVALRLHWARVGLRAGAHANPHAWFKMCTGVDLVPAVVAGLPDFVAASADLEADATTPEALSHLATVPMPGASVFDMEAPGMVGFFTDLARHKRRSGDTATAEWLLSRVLDHAPGDPRASLDLADLIHPQNRIASETQLRRAVPNGFDAGANQITLAERLVVQNRLSEALEVCRDLPAALFGDVALRRRRRDLGGAIFNTIWSDLSSWIERRPIAELQAMLAEALALYTPPFTAPERGGPIRRVAILANDDIYQCKLYRADQKIDQLRAAGYSTELYLQGLDLDLLRGRLDQYDAVIFMRVPAFLPIIDLIVDAARQGLATFYDIDDLIFDPAVFPPPLASYGGQITRRDHAAIACGVPLFRHAMSLCSHGIASTPTIRDAMEGIVRSGMAFTHRNALGRAHMAALAHQATAAADRGEKLVIFYGSGTKAHKAVFTDMLEPALADVLAARPGKVEIRIMGDFPAFKHLDPAHPDIRLLAPIWDFEGFCAALAEADINLSVLEPSVLTDAKSEIKWMEAAMFAIPSVVNPTATYRDVIIDGQTGLFAQDRKSFAAALLRLIDDADLRGRIGAAAQAVVVKDYGLPAMGAQFDAIFAAIRPPTGRGKTRLLIVNVFYPPQDIGGATRVVHDNVRDLVARYGDDYEIDILATLEGGERPYEIGCHAHDGVRIWTVTARDGIDNMEIRDHRMADVIDRLIGRIAPDLVHLHCLQRLTASVVDCLRRRRLPYVVTLHDGWWVSPHQFILSPEGEAEIYSFRPEDRADLSERGGIAARALRDAAAVLAVSESFAGLHREAGLDRVEVVENGLAAATAVARVSGPPGRVRLGHIGGAARHKGYHLLRAALHAKRFENLDLLVVDHALPSGRVRYEDWNGTPVTFVPRVPLTQVGTLYGALDVVLAPSIWPESYGLVTREALAAGLWVVASDRGAIGQDIVQNENGFVVDVADHRGMMNALAKIDADPVRFLSPPVHRLPLRSAQAQTDQLHAIYQRILASRATLHPTSEDEVCIVEIGEGDA